MSIVKVEVKTTSKGTVAYLVNGSFYGLGNANHNRKEAEQSVRGIFEKYDAEELDGLVSSVSPIIHTYEIEVES